MSGRLTETQVRDIAGEASQTLRRSGVDVQRAEQVGKKIAAHVAAKVEGQPVPERFQPIKDSRRGR